MLDIVRHENKDKRAWHVTCATHNSRYSQRMFDNYVKLGPRVWLSEKEEQIVTETIAEIAKKDKLNILAYNICGDHIHILLVCEEERLSRIIQKIKSMSARACNIAMGRTIPTREPAPLSEESASSATDSPTRELAPLSSEEGTSSATDSPTREPASLSGKRTSSRGTTQAHLWTQKFGKKKILYKKQLYNTIKYIQNNRIKHGLPANKGNSKTANSLDVIIEEMCKSSNQKTLGLK